ncbi:hypothetical protein ALC53_05798 [Atta colombica]|uniref:Uncharacterized protein n=1 Tax=Atta colombica TaxID=520822 RepID=A0A195BHU3_9HYME|nr:hypothetical protein ALC53_05798 [Atta colombica]
MSRGKATASSIVPSRANRGEGGRQHHEQRTLLSISRHGVTRRLRLSRDHDELLDGAKGVATIADLEAFAVSIVAFFGEDASTTGAAARGRDRSMRSTGGGSASGNEVSVRRERAASREARGDWVHEAKRTQALYRAAARQCEKCSRDLPISARCRVQKYFESRSTSSDCSCVAAARKSWPAPAYEHENRTSRRSLTKSSASQKGFLRDEGVLRVQLRPDARQATAKGYTVRVTHPVGHQNCPLRPIIFNLAIDFVVRVAAESIDGYILHEYTWSALALLPFSDLADVLTRSAAIKIPSDARGQIVNRLRSTEHAGRLLGKPDQGKVFEVSSQSRVSNHFIRGSSFTRFTDWRFIHKAQLDILPLNSA